tara:strand:+ start:2952 stop:4418 length:1467 start_codon:yes stop_codon:yes gene_type:complete
MLIDLQNKIIKSLAVMLLIPISVWAGDSNRIKSVSELKPYNYKDRGSGPEKFETTINKNRLSSWLSLSAQQRVRYETLNRQFRSRANGSDQAVSIRTLAQITARLNQSFKIHFELQDSRVEKVDSGTKLNASVVNSAELLESNIEWITKGLFQPGSISIFRLGRLTADIGKRRFLARNRFRNTKNAFTGIDWIWKSNDNITLRILGVLPVVRQPTTSKRILKNDVFLDKESFDRVLWGLFCSKPNMPWGGKGEFYLFGLIEKDGSGFATRNRTLYTPGFRFFRHKKSDKFDYEWETAFQFGKSRATLSSADTFDLDHFAHFHHIEMGYRFSGDWSPRLVLAFDYASGDRDPNDGSNGRFDTLFGATVFDFGPTGIYRPFVRSNIFGPGIKLEIKPNPRASAYIHYRSLWLASSKDLWTGNSGLRDVDGNSDSFLGQQWFLRAKWQVLANMRLEAGIAYRIDGNFQKTASLSPRAGETIFSYLSTTLVF